jgi:hypothetical protein
LPYGRGVTIDAEPLLARAVRIVAGVLVIVVVAQVIAGLAYRIDGDFDGDWRETFGALGQALTMDTGIALLLTALAITWLNTQRPQSPYDARALLVVAAYVLVISLGVFVSIITYSYDEFPANQQDEWRIKAVTSLRGPLAAAVLAGATIAIVSRGPRDREWLTSHQAAPHDDDDGNDDLTVLDDLPITMIPIEDD